MKKIYLFILALCISSMVQNSFGQSTTFNWNGTSPGTGSVQTYTVPAGVTALGVDAIGAGGGYPYYQCGNTVTSAVGGRVQCHLAVTPGQILYIYVGSKGGDDGCNGAGYTTVIGGFNGGQNSQYYGGASGGATDIRLSAGTVTSTIPYQVTPYTSTNRVVVAGGGGGGADYYGTGGAGGGLIGGTGVVGTYGGTPGAGGTQSGAGSGGSTTGSLGVGGAAASYGPGGGGYWGGNGGTTYAGGGGGSSYTDPTLCTSVVHTQGYSGASGNGQVILTVLCNNPGTITGTMNVCVGSNTSLSDPTSITGGTWSSSNTAVGTINASTGVVTGISTGTTTITYTVDNPCGPLATAVVSVNPLPTTITGPTGVCIGSSISLASTPTGGSWTTSSPTISVGATSGVVSGISGGIGVITYSLPTGCTVATSVSVSTAPAAITGASVICPGSSTVLSDATSGGSWSSSNLAQATIGSSTGVLTGISGGFPTITYTSATGCIATTIIDVNSLDPIVGTLGLCTLGATTTLTDGTAGGNWSSSNTAVATIGSASGLLTSVSYGSSTISYSVPSSGCTVTAVIGVTTTAGGLFTMTGGGSYCTGSTGVVVGLSGSTSGVSYQLFNGTGAVGSAISGIGFGFNFPIVTDGTYYVVADYGSSCALTMSGSAVVTANPLPTAYTVSGGGTFCSGTSGAHIYLNSSSIGINYQLMLGTSPVGTAIAGTSASLDFGAQTASGTYSVVATNATTGCVNNMSNTVDITVSSLPSIFTVTPSTGGYCTGGTGVTVGLSNSTLGVNYTLYFGGVATGTVVSGTGLPISFGLQTAAGTYTVVGTSTSTSCSSNMSGSAVIAINALPTVYTVTGGGSYCTGGSGVHIGINSSTVGVNYQLYNGTTAVGSAFPGSGASLDFGLYTATGSYTVVAVNAATLCTNTMFGSAVVVINPLPTSFTVTGGGSYCASGTGLPVGLSGSISGTNYSLYNGATLVGGASGTGSALSFGLQTAAGTYTVVATNTATGCTQGMSGSVTIVINPLPAIFTVTSSATSYCAGGSGVHVGLSGSTSGINYQLYTGGVVSGAVVTGTGAGIDFGLRTAAGSYTVVAVNPGTGCTSNMTGSISITINPLPTVYTVTGGAPYCAGTAGSVVGLSSSSTGFLYQLYNGVATVGTPLAGTGASLTFGLQTLTGTYTVIATNTTTGCTATMSGSPVISILPLPTAYTVTGTGAYCAGGAGVHVLLSNSASGVTYQLLNGTVPTGTVATGSGFPLDFGAQTAAGTYFVVATNTATTCTSNMLGSAVITINPLPVAYTVTGGGSYCAGGSGVHVGVIATTTGVTYQLYNGPATVGAPVAGTGSAIDFGAFTAAGTYTVLATNTVTGCTNLMSGSVMIAINPLPSLHTITGGGNYCFGSTGSDIQLNGSESGYNYQLFVGGVTAGVPVSGTGSSIDFGLQTTTGTYTIVATNAATGCSVNMIGSTIVGVNPLPGLHTVTGGGNYCPGGAGVHVGVNISDVGTSYQLFNSGVAVGGLVAGTGLVLDFGLQTATGVYTVVAVNTTTSCTRTMSGSVTVGLSPLPTPYNVTGGGNYCPSGSGVHIGLSGSNLGVTYQLTQSGLPVIGASVTGTGLPIDFGLITITGTYTVVASSTLTTCSNNMTGSVNVGVAPLPAVHTVTGGGNYCPSGTGIDIGLNGSNTGISYQLFNGTSAVGTPVAGTGSALDFGLHTATGTYTVVALSSGTSCSNGMAGSATIGISPLPVAYNVTGGGSYCAGGSGVHIMLGGSISGDNYQLFNGITPVGTVVAGTGAGLDFGAQTGAGTYTVIASDATTGCTNTMTGSVVIVINALPNVYSVTGGGNYCLGGTGVHVLLNGSNTGVSYQLTNLGSPVGSPVAGTGFSIDFGLQTATGIYSVVAINTTTGCTNNMLGTVTIGTNPLPSVYAVSSTSSNYCAGGTGVDISLSGSGMGINYQLYRGGSPVGTPVAGTGSGIDFGFNTLAGTYTAVALNSITGCSSNMASSVTVVINALPIAYSITGGGNFCSGGSGVVVGLSGSNAGILYQLYIGSAPSGTPIAGTGSALTFGLQTAAGIYHIVATSPSTTCSNTMSGTVSISLNPLPTPYTVTGGGNYCAGGTGADVALSSSNTGISYQLYAGTAPVGSPMSGTGGGIDFGMQTAAGNYTIVATNTTTLCAGNMAGSVPVAINPLPSVFTVTGGGNYCMGSAGVHVGTTGSTPGISYQLFRGGVASGTPITGFGSSIDFGLQTVAGNYTVVATNSGTMCSNNMSGSVNVVVNALPNVYNVTGGGAYCASGSGVHVNLNSSTIGVNYTLYHDLMAVGGSVSGVGGILDMGLQTLAGTYTVVATNVTTGCLNNMAGSATVSITPQVTPAVSISTTASDTICSGNLTTFTAAPVYGGTAPAYSWSVNGIPVTATGNTYSYIPVNGDLLAVLLVSSEACVTSADAIGHLTMNVQTQGAPAVAVAATPGNVVCAGTSVTFTASPSFGGSAPSYSWFTGTTSAGTGPTLTYVPENGDVVYCVMTSDYHCRTANTGTSAHITMEVDNMLTPTVTVSANPAGHISAGQSVTFTATVSNGGIAPAFQWSVNGAQIPGAVSATFTTNVLSDNDVVSCMVTTTGGCAGGTGTGSATVHFSGVGVQSVTTTGSDLIVVPNPNKGIFTVKGNLTSLTDEEVTLEVTNTIGQVVYSNKVMSHNGEVNQQVQLSNVANGMYILSLRSGSDSKVFHLVVEQ